MNTLRPSAGLAPSGDAPPMAVRSPLRLRIIRNPRAAGGRKGRLFAEVSERLAAAGVEVELLETARAGDAARMVREAHADTTDRIVIAGGDGTINDALQGLQPDTPPLAILPIGTANVLAHELGLGRSAADLTRYLLQGRAEQVYPGRINGWRFLSVASAGSDAQAVEDLPRGAKKRWGKLAYLIYGVKSFALRGCPPFPVEVDGTRHMVSIIIANRGTRYGGDHVLAPSARLSDTALVVTLLPPGGRVATFLRLAGIAFGRTRQDGRYSQFRCADVHIPGPEGAPIQADGDVIARLPARITVEQTPVKLIFPD